MPRGLRALPDANPFTHGVFDKRHPLVELIVEFYYPKRKIILPYKPRRGLCLGMSTITPFHGKILRPQFEKK
jgi:hypothetical protein